jgi:menaquinone-dependent protoporphyrinogen oxidase
MDRIAVIYATWHGQAREVAQHVANIAASRGLAVDISEVNDAPGKLDAYAGVAIVGSVHFGRHSLALTRFARRNREWLTANPSAFFSISGAAISMEGRKTAQAQIDAFLRSTGWQPDLSVSLAGAIPFTKYDPLTRWAMKYASRFAGRPADTSRDYDYTNWFDADEGMQALINAIERHARVTAEPQLSALS